MKEFPRLPALGAAPPDLLPTQAADLAALKDIVGASPVVAFRGQPGMGRTTLLRRLARDCDGFLVETDAIVRILADYPVGDELEAMVQYVMDAMRDHRLVIFDDFDDVVLLGRRGLISSLFRQAWLEIAVGEDRRLVLAGNVERDRAIYLFGKSPVVFSTSPLTEDDYRQMLGEGAAGADIGLFYRNAPMLDLYQLTYFARLIAGKSGLTAKQLLTVLDQEVLQTNLKIEEVEQLDFSGLPGTEAIAAKLESHVIQPFLNKELAQELGLKPCRGVLLYGPPGTGKTSIGRVLAHRMEGRFFLIDGSFVTEPPTGFFGAVAGIVRAAKAASPSVIFIDDADVLFQIEHIAGLSRYLLSLLDGLESETASHVCVVMTAMDAYKVPEALLRSGRVELWLETKAPDAENRAAILQRWMNVDVGGFGQLDHANIAQKTEGFTPADLRRLAGEARLLYAGDIARARPVSPAESYVDQAIAAILAQREEMSRQLGAEALRGRAYA